MKYATLSNNQIHYAPPRMRIGDAWVYNPTEAQLLSEGYLPVIETAPPEVDERHYAESRWTEADGQIVQSWEIEAFPDEVSPEEIAAAIEEALT